MKELRRRWGDDNEEKARWLGHIVRIPDHRLPKSMLFGWLPQSRPRCGPRKRWRDIVRKKLEWMKRNGMEQQGSQEQGERLCIGWVWRVVEKRSCSMLQ